MLRYNLNLWEGIMKWESNLGSILIVLWSLFHLTHHFTNRVDHIPKIHISTPFMVKRNTNYFWKSLSNIHYCVVLREAAHIYPVYSDIRRWARGQIEGFLISIMEVKNKDKTGFIFTITIWVPFVLPVLFNDDFFDVIKCISIITRTKQRFSGNLNLLYVSICNQGNGFGKK